MYYKLCNKLLYIDFDTGSGNVSVVNQFVAIVRQLRPEGLKHEVILLQQCVIWYICFDGNNLQLTVEFI